MKDGTCELGDKCPFPHHDANGVAAVKAGLQNTKNAAAKAKPKAKAEGKKE